MSSTFDGRSNSQTRTYYRASSFVFRKTKEQFGGLSNMAAGFPLKVNSVDIRTSEALYQACRFPHKPDVQRLIIRERSPMTAKMKSKSYRDETRSDWDQVRVRVMRWCLRVKLAQNWQKFSSLLLATGDNFIVEESRKDDFWGAKPNDDDTLTGKNVLGRLLMELREELRKGDQDRLTRIEPLNIPSFVLCDTPIGVIEAFRQTPPVIPTRHPEPFLAQDSLPHATADWIAEKTTTSARQADLPLSIFEGNSDREVLSTIPKECKRLAGALEEDARLTVLFLWMLQRTNGSACANDDADAAEVNDETEGEEKTLMGKPEGYSLILDFVRRFAQPLGIRLPKWEGRIIEINKGVIRLLPVAERAKQLFGAPSVGTLTEETEASPLAAVQLILFPEEVWTVRGRGKRRTVDTPTAGPFETSPQATTLDRVHAAMLLQASGQSLALHNLLNAEQERGPDFLRLANALSALYPRHAEEKRLLNIMLLAVPR